MAFTKLFYFVADKSFTADGGPVKPTGGLKTTPQKTRFCSVKELQEIHIQVKSQFW